MRHARKKKTQENMVPKQEKEPSIEIISEEGHVLDLPDKDLKSVMLIILKKIQSIGVHKNDVSPS